MWNVHSTIVPRQVNKKVAEQSRLTEVYEQSFKQMWYTIKYQLCNALVLLVLWCNTFSFGPPQHHCQHMNTLCLCLFRGWVVSSSLPSPVSHWKTCYWAQRMQFIILFRLSGLPPAATVYWEETSSLWFIAGIKTCKPFKCGSTTFTHYCVADYDSGLKKSLLCNLFW